jgi:N-acetyl-1-D-myo-inositol-2-amino-2-deoxy-alpha-D-glucopyranoside deacetylase
VVELEPLGQRGATTGGTPGHRFTGSDALGTPDDELTAVVDVERHLDDRWRAIRAHASQVPPFAAMPADLQYAFLAVDRLVQVDPPWAAGSVASDWIP